MTVELSAREMGEGPVLILLHGLFGSSRNWVSVQKQLAQHYHVVSLDLRNHGNSPWHAQMHYEAMAQDVIRFIGSKGWDAVSLLGHSMGGKVAMTVALRAPQCLARLIVADIAPVTYRPHFSDFIAAMRALDLSQISRRSDADKALAQSISEPGVRAFLLQNLVQNGSEWGWKINLPVLDDALEALGEWPLQTESLQWPGPVCAIRGDASDYVLSEHEPAFERYFPAVNFVTLVGAGHWLHAEQPVPFVEQINLFMNQAI